MTKSKPKPKPKKPNRSRGVAIQVYVSREERADLRMIARRRGVSLSTLVRDWTRRSAAGIEAREPKAPAVDPRQMPLAAACDCCDECPLAHVGIHDASCAANGPV